MPSDITTLTDLANDFLAVAVTCLDETTAGAPATQYVSPAAPAFDCCPAVIVHVASLSEESTSPFSPTPATGRRASYGRVILAQLVLTTLRCAPQMQQDGSVLTDDIEAVAVTVQEDAWAIFNCVQCAVRNGVWEDKCRFVHWDRSVSINEQGGCVGWQFVVRVEIDGIPCEEPTT